MGLDLWTGKGEGKQGSLSRERWRERAREALEITTLTHEVHRRIEWNSFPSPTPSRARYVVARDRVIPRCSGYGQIELCARPGDAPEVPEVDDGSDGDDDAGGEPQLEVSSHESTATSSAEAGHESEAATLTNRKGFEVVNR